MKSFNKKPSAWICTNDENRQNRGRAKIYQPQSKVYLNDNEEFEIELFNPSSYNVKAIIKIDGKTIMQGGLVLRSGERVYLECFPGNKKKFTFKTYEVENSNEAIEAISENGNVEINFYREKIIDYYFYNRTNFDTSIPIGNTRCYDNTSTVFGSPTTTLTNFGSSSDTVTTAYFSSNIETGQVDGGLQSNQDFTTVDMDFETWVLSSYSFKLLPMSQKPAEPKEFKVDKKKVNTIDNKIKLLSELNQLKESGAITHKEFKEMKSEIMD